MRLDNINKVVYMVELIVSNFLKDIIKETGNEYASLVSDGVDSGI